jgi:hypothetical protein
MKKTFLKTVVATGVVTAVMALSSVAVFASVYTDVDNTTLWTGSSAKTIDAKSVQADKLTSPIDATAYGITFTNVKYDTGNNRLELYNQADTSNYKNGSSIAITPDFKVNFKTTIGNKDVMVADSNGNSTTYKAGDLSIDLDAGVTYTFTNAATSGAGRARFDGGFTLTKLSGTVYDDSLFEDETTDKTAVVAGSTVKTTVTSADIITEALGGTPSDDKIALGKDVEVGTLTFDSKFLAYKDNSIRTGGSSSTSNGKYITFQASEGDVITLTGCKSQSDDATRVAYLATTVGGTHIDEAFAPVAKGNVSLTAPAAGTYYVCFSNGIQFDGVTVYAGESATIPYVTLSKVSGEEGKVTLKGVINGDADDSLPVTAIKVVTAKGYDANDTKVAAKSHDINVVAPDGDDYAFLVTIDEDSANDTGFEIQASVDYEKNGATATSYSAVVEYAVVG